MENCTVERRFVALGTYIYLRIVTGQSGSASKAQTDLNRIEDFFRGKEKILSRFDSESELWRFNHNLGQYLEAAPDIHNVARRSLDYYEISEGIFDPRILSVLENIGYGQSFSRETPAPRTPTLPSTPIVTWRRNLKEDLIFDGSRVCFHQKMDFSGIAKGYINDLAVNLLREMGWKNFILDSGGDLFAAGFDENHEKWRIIIDGAPNLLVTVSDQAVATSGIVYRKWNYGDKEYFHLINPKAPEQFTTPFLSVSVVKPSTEEADVWAKVLFLMGEKARDFVVKNNINAIFIYSNGDVWKTC